MDLLGAMTVFARVAEEGSFSGAARVLGLSKSSVSKQLAQLEDHLGARLINRTTRRLALTEAGAAYWERCRRILDDLEEANAAVSALQGAPRGLLRVNGPVSFGTRVLGPAIVDFLRRYRDVAIDLSLSDRKVDVVAEGYDVVIRIGHLRDSSLFARKLGDSARPIVASPAYLARRGTPTHPRELAGHDCLIYSLMDAPHLWRFRRGDETAEVKVDGPVVADHGDIQREAVFAGLGLSIIPDFLVGEDIAAGRLVSVLDDWTSEPAPIHAVYPHNRHLSAKVRVFIDFLHGWMREHCYCTEA